VSTLFYDADCDLCRWTAAKIAAWDRRGAVNIRALQDRVVSERLLGSMDEQARMASWHLVTPDGRVHSAGRGVAPLLRLLPGGGPVARVATAAGPLTERAYRFVASHRSAIGRLISRAARERAAERLRAQARA
jgi:predicted DCC family thiol-disulfide oxidoreductase YuxK